MKPEDKESFQLSKSQPSTLTPVSTMNAVQYNWGKECKAWFLLKNPKLTVIQEEMPPGSSDLLHFHHKAKQLFYILRGEATMEIGDKFVELKPSQSLHIAPGNPHCIRNTGLSALKFHKRPRRQNFEQELTARRSRNQTHGTGGNRDNGEPSVPSVSSCSTVWQLPETSADYANYAD
jgi:mannose-6-phosphate isomerase-like protein (cupin superfamily)